MLTIKNSANAAGKGIIFLMISWVIVFNTAFTPPNQKSAGKKRGGQITFDSETIKMGELQSGKAYSKTVKFTNTGNAVLRISGTQSACGAYISEFPNKPIKPNESGTMKIVFVPKDNPGFFSKSLIVESNSVNGYDYLYLQGTIVSSSASR